jgi:hypothetical protein
VQHPLTRALASAGLNADDVAARLAVDPKTVQRWFTGQKPYPRHRAALTEITGWDARDLWPDVSAPVSPSPGADEVRMVYASRAAVPVDVWHTLFRYARREIIILAYSGLFLAEDATAQRILHDKAADGVQVRIALGDPDGGQVARRGADEGIDGAMAGKIRNALVLCRPLIDVPRVEIRLHDTVLYSSIYRADDELLVNHHVHGCPASHTPVLHLRRQSGDEMVATYVHSSEQVWDAARPIKSTALRRSA